MKDVVFEWYIPYIPGKKQLLLKAVITSAVLVFLFDAFVFAPGMFYFALALAVFGFFLFRSWKFEYEYVYVNGDFTVSKIIRKAKRKDIYQADRLRFDDFVKGRATVPGKSVKDLTSGRPDAAVYTIKTAQQLVYIEPCEDFLNEMKKYYHGL